MAYVSKKLSPAHRQKRIEYALQHQSKSIDDFWRYVVFTDEAHIDPSSQGVGRILREAGTRTDSVNVQERPSKEGVKLHIAAWVSWDAKAPQLLFYNDEEEFVYQPLKRTRPRRLRYDTNELYEHRLQ
jgi:hypothetical protein